MKNLLIILSITLILPSFSFAGGNDEDAIKKVIQSAYVDGLQNKGPVADIEAGFHPGFNLLGVNNDALTKWPIYSWVQYHEKKIIEDSSPVSAEEKTTCKFPMVDITGNAAVVKIELYKGGSKIFTDYLSLYKFEEGWKIVSKIYYRHEKKE